MTQAIGCVCRQKGPYQAHNRIVDAEEEWRWWTNIERIHVSFGICAVKERVTEGIDMYSSTVAIKKRHVHYRDFAGFPFTALPLSEHEQTIY